MLTTKSGSDDVEGNKCEVGEILSDWMACKMSRAMRPSAGRYIDSDRLDSEVTYDDRGDDDEAPEDEDDEDEADDEWSLSSDGRGICSSGTDRP